MPNITTPDGESIPVAFVPRGAQPDDPNYAPGGARTHLSAPAEEPIGGPKPVEQPGDPSAHPPQTIGQVASPASADAAGPEQGDEPVSLADAKAAIGAQPEAIPPAEVADVEGATGTPIDITDKYTVEQLAAAADLPEGESMELDGVILTKHRGPGAWDGPVSDGTSVSVEHPDGTVQDVGPGKYGIASGNVADAVHVTAGGVFVDNERVPATGLQEHVSVAHPTCDDDIVEVTVRYLARRVDVQQDAAVPQFVDDLPHHETEHGCTCQLAEPTKTVVDLVNQTRRGLRRFVLQRARDDTGVSGTGIVAEGVLMTDGRAVVRWLGKNSSIVIWDNLSDAMQVHGHRGATRLRWLDHA